MAIKNFWTKNKKKSSCIIAAMLLAIIALFIILYNKNANAGVFMKDDKGNSVQVNEINVLEVVAEYGQQVIGYTVKGYEPITKDMIENYTKGDIDIDDFKDATGWVIEKKANSDGSFSYTVKQSLLNETFNSNVLGDSMADGEIKVTVCQSNELTVDMINSADLIYINSNDSNDNLLYYYDQIMNNGEMGIALGEKGYSYNSSHMEDTLVADIALNNIIEAAGHIANANLLTVKDFELAGVTNIYAYNIEEYRERIASLEADSLKKDDNAAEVTGINEMINEINTAEKQTALEYIISLAGKNISEEDKETVSLALQKGEWTGYFEANKEAYFEQITAYTSGLNNARIQYLISTVNASCLSNALDIIKQVKSLEEVDEDTVMSVQTAFTQTGYDAVNESLLDDYYKVFISDKFIFSNISSNTDVYNDIKNLIDTINSEKHEEALTLIADVPGNQEKSEEIKANEKLYFELAGIEGYDVYNLSAYINKLTEMTDINQLKSLTANGDSYVYDIEKLKEFVLDVNEECKTTEVEVSSDIAWANAKAIYDYAMVGEKGLTYNTQLLTDAKIGDYTVDSKDNVNNMYKILLIMRQLRDSYVNENIMRNIDNNGVYYSEGIDENGIGIGEGISAWWKGTFGNDYNNYSKYREPDVVGTTYGESGTTVGASANYVYKHIYSFTGGQFFGGRNFVNTELVDTSDLHYVETANTGYHDYSDCNIENTTFDETEKFIFLDTGAYSCNWGSAYAYFWNSSGSSSAKWVQMTSHDSSKKQFRVVVPDDADRVIFATDTSFSNQTVDIVLPTNFDGMQYYVTSSENGEKYKVNTSYSGRNMYFGNLTNSIRTDSNITSTPEDEYVVDYTGSIDLCFKAYNITNASYRLNDTGAWIALSANQIITLGNELPVGTVTNIRIQYNTYGTTAERSYWYRKTADGYDISISNVIDNGRVYYYGYMDMDVNYSGAISNIKYSINDGEENSIVSNESIRIGQDLSAGERTKVSFSYNVDNEMKTATFHLIKKEYEYSSDNCNYKSLYTATDNESLSIDNLQTQSVNDIIADGTKGEIVRYIIGASLNELTSIPMRILEIEPAANVSFLDSYESALRLADYLNVSVPNMKNDNYKTYFNITSMSVKEFNTRNEDLTAEYDMIYIGVDSGYMKVNRYNYNGEKFYRTKYRDSSMNGLVYTGIGDKYDVKSFMKGVAASDFAVTTASVTNTKQKTEQQYWKDYFFDGFTNNIDSSWNLDASKTYLMVNSKTYARLGGTDITVKRLDSLLDYLKAGYPILLADEIMNCDTEYYKDAKETDTTAEKAYYWKYVDTNSKMHQFVIQAKALGYDSALDIYTGKDSEGNNIFADGKGYASLVSESFAKNGRNPDNLDAGHKFEGGLSFATKRVTKVDFELKSCPTEYNKDTSGNRVGNGRVGTTIAKSEDSNSEYKRYNYVLDINTDVSSEWMQENYKYVIYIDKSGVGNFEESTLVEIEPESVIYSEDCKSVTISGDWPGNMEGFIPWKIVAYNVNNVENKYSYTGFSAFQNQSGAKKDVYVLWVRTEYPNNHKPFNLDFSNMVSKYASNITDYNIHLVSLSYSEFVNMWSKETNSVTTTYNASNSLLKVKLTMQYQQNIGASQSKNYNINYDNVDNSEFNMIVFGYCDSYVGLDISSIQALKNIKYFVNSGHSLLFAHDNASYISSMNYFTNTKGSVLDGGYNWGRYSTSYLRKMLGMDMYGITSSSSNLSESASNARKYLSSSLTQVDYRGFTEGMIFNYTQGSDGNEYGNQIYTASKYSSSTTDINDWVKTKRIMKVNEGQITEYPFVMSDILTTNETHTQYMMLDLEDEDVNVWYTLDGTSGLYFYTKGDGANNYYIYSKGNITYTGSGHSTTSDSEQLLFMNTVIAAIKLGALQPTVLFPYAYIDTTTNQYYMYAYEGDSGVTVYFRPVDYDSNSGEASFTDCKIFIDINDDGYYTEGDVLLNVPSDSNAVSKYMKDKNNQNYINITSDSMLNRNTYSFMITFEDLNKIAETYIKGVSVADYKKLLESHKIYVEITNNGTKKDPSAKLTVNNSLKVYLKKGVTNNSKLFDLD